VRTTLDGLESLSGHVALQRQLFADVRALEAVQFAVLLHDGAARTQAVRRDVREHVAVQSPVLSDTPAQHRTDLDANVQKVSK